MKSEALSLVQGVKIGFVVLHYNSYDTTINCVESILNLDGQEQVKIVVVDNHSPNNSGYELYNKYTSNPQVEVVILDKNYGFSKANNIGFSKLIKNGSYKYIVITNNDIIFKQNNFISLLDQAYRNRGFYVGGPDIYAIYKEEHQSPLALHPRTEEQIRSWIRENEKKLRFVRMESILRKIWLKVNKTKLYYVYCKFKKEPIIKKKNWNKEQDNIVLSGACLFFSEKFIDLQVNPFEPETDFYHEEDILTARCLKKQLEDFLYSRIECASFRRSGYNEKNYYNKMKFRYTNFIKSGKVYLNYISKGKGNE